MRVRRFAVAAGLTLALGGSLLTPADADTPQSRQSHLQHQIAATKDALENSSARMRQAAIALVRVRAELPAVRSAYAQAQGRLNAAREELNAIRDHIAVLRDIQDRTKRRIQVTSTHMDQTQDVINQIARETYQDNGMAELSVVLDAESPSDFVERVMNNEIVTSREGEIIGQLLAAQAALVGHQQELETTQIGLQQTKRQAHKEVQRIAAVAATAKAARDRLLSLAAAKRQALSVARQEKSNELARLKQLQAAQRRLAALIARTASSGSGQVPTGSLLWPVDGYPITGGVGWRVHPVYGYRSCHTGVDIGAPSGTPVHSAASGVVVWVQADDGGPYGNNVLVDHGNGLSTFYAHLSSFLVHQGQHVSRGQTVALSGNSGWSTGPHLHFEVHINGVPYDPMGWFGGAMRSESQFCP